jgi:hypothetical protein
MGDGSKIIASLRETEKGYVFYESTVIGLRTVRSITEPA